MVLEDFKSKKIDLKKIHGGTYGNGAATVEIIGYKCPCSGTIVNGELIEEQGTPVYSFDEGSYY